MIDKTRMSHGNAAALPAGNLMVLLIIAVGSFAADSKGTVTYSSMVVVKQKNFFDDSKCISNLQVSS